MFSEEKNVSKKNNLFNIRLKWRIDSFSQTILLIFSLYSTINIVQSIDHCYTHRYNKSVNSTYMQFTKEVISSEYAVLGDFKSLHCCAKAYRSIEWFKDGKPYPWSADISSLILYPEAANQTIYTRQIQYADVGNYSCVLSNDTHRNEQNLSLQVQEKLPDMPLATFRPQDQVIELNQPARLYCEAFVGKVELPDARADISWYQMFEDDQEQDVDGVQEQISRENGQIVGSYLTIPHVKLHNYGRYLCRIQIGSAAHRLEMYALIFGKAHGPHTDQTLLLGLIAAVLAVILVLLVWYMIICCNRKNSKKQNNCQAHASARRV